MDKHSSLFCRENIDTKGRGYKTFYESNL